MVLMQQHLMMVQMVTDNHLEEEQVVVVELMWQELMPKHREVQDGYPMVMMAVTMVVLLIHMAV